MNEKQIIYIKLCFYSQAVIRRATKNLAEKASGPKPLSRLYPVPSHTADKSHFSLPCLHSEPLFMISALPRLSLPSSLLLIFYPSFKAQVKCPFTESFPQSLQSIYCASTIPLCPLASYDGYLYAYFLSPVGCKLRETVSHPVDGLISGEALTLMRVTI